MSEQSHIQQEWLSLIAKGDEKAFTDFFVHYSGPVHAFIYNHSGDKDLADDILQDIFTKIWLTRESLEEVKNISAYLFTIARHHVINLLKQKIRDRKRHLEWHTLHTDAHPAESMETLLTVIDKAIEQLPERQRKTWLLSRREGKKYTEIATELGVSRETVKTNLQLANAGITKYVLEHIELAAAIFILRIF
ncbi:RNA polymerase sigma factor [Parasegetibacter sp. NRK P23]|uniref:RNA polymerase sigma factor n=1 Tax=Parasegetibacter sp. NRK P23 TaxID=2942999 RepID=UPI0020432209|nr:sigma-70 family RNA polymerase sigma factor [Parasegetibacter sp. NRK P23]MCM5528413.1 sigma-70 family RNA polymerase sigma factor [Parasegetibacter sp. NRK P23]